MNFNLFFQRATGHLPYPYQRSLATAEELPSVLSIPTGLGKTAAMTLAWLWRRRYGSPEIARATPRRLAYCLPMRVLVEQTRDAVVTWLDRLGILGGHVEVSANGTVSYDPWAGADDPSAVRVWLLLGGDVERDWDRFPERDAILVGTQDLLLSRALARGYAMSRFRWPLQFGLVNNDTLWVYDEVQLMGSGLATSAQLQAFRRQLGAYRARSVWMSATIQPSWLDTVDFDREVDAPGDVALGPEDAAAVAHLVRAPKRLTRAGIEASHDGKTEARAVLELHRPGTRSLVVVNTVRRATEIYRALKKLTARDDDSLELVLVHSRFRPLDRTAAVTRLVREPPAGGTIAVSTQVIEAGVDVSARILWTDIAPWPSLVQRFGRCNRKGLDQDAEVRWFDTPLDPKKEQTGPYRTADLIDARKTLGEHTSAASADLQPVSGIDEAAHVLRRRDLVDLFDAAAPARRRCSSTTVLRRRDLVDLFDTSQDLAGADIDVSRFIRDGDDHSVFVFWRQVGEGGPTPSEPRPRREELCPAPIADVRDRIKKKGQFWRWDFQDRRWAPARGVVPGTVLMAPASQGDYDPDLGWLPRPSRQAVPTVVSDLDPDEAVDDDPHAHARRWQTIAEHTDDVVAALEDLLAALGDELPAASREALREATRWHDRGKAHEVFQGALAANCPDEPPGALWGKSGGKMERYARRGFRHELASALAMLQAGLGDLPAFLAVAHHGKVRLALRGQPTEREPDDPSLRFALGVWEGDHLEATELGGGVVAPETTLSLRYAELGVDSITGPSWVERVLALRDDPELGPFRLAYLEALMCVADWRGSEEPEDEERTHG